jgi:predicted nuclease of predicted toxin-antitoxin system
MRLLLDECVPRPLKRDLADHQAATVVEMGWSSKRNGELLDLVRSEDFDAFLTVDQNLSFQQNLQSAGVAVVLVIARTNRLKELRPLVPAILAALAGLKRGGFVQVGA